MSLISRFIVILVKFMAGFIEKFILSSLRDSSNPIELSNGFPVAACFKNLNLVDIPQVMREKKLVKGAALMERWFVGKSFAMPQSWKAAPPNAIDPRTIPPENVNETIVTMQWALGFARALSVYRELKSAVSGTLGSASLEASKVELFASLASDRKFTNKVERFGLGTAKALHKTAHINTRLVGSNMSDKLSDPLDDLYCALGVFGIHAAASGTVTPLDSKMGVGSHQVKIEKIGFYIKDNYDFNDDQPLGLWDHNGIYKVPLSGRLLVENRSFRQWRARFNHGGDFMLFSDVRWEGMSTPLLWNYNGG